MPHGLMRADPGPPPQGTVVAQSSALLLVRGEDAARHVRPPPTVLGLAYLFVLFVLWLLNLADLFITVHWTGSVGWAAEGNALMRHVAHIFGASGFAVYKVLLMTFVVLVLWWLYLRFEAEAVVARARWRVRVLEGMRWGAFGATIVLLAFYVWVLWNNLHISGIV